MEHDMRRSDRELGQDMALEILKQGTACHLALVAGCEPYLVTLNYGFEGSTLYFHCANSGKKLDIIRDCDKVCFSVISRHELVLAEKACDYSMKYESVVGFGRARMVEEPAEKRRALQLIMNQYVPGEFTFADEPRTTVFAVDIDKMCAKGTF